MVAICLVPLPGRQDHFLDLAQSVFAKEDLIADKEGRRAERAARDRALGIVEQPRLDLGVLDQRRKLFGVEARFAQYRLPAYGRADFRVDKRWDFGQGRWLTGVVEFFDATLTKEAVDFDCNFTRHTCTPAYVGPIALPSIGLEAGW